MKLHLPLALRAALLAVLCATQVWADRTLTIDGVEEKDWDGIIDEILQGTEFEITLSGSTTNTVELQGGGFIAYDSGDKATITVGDGGIFTQNASAEESYIAYHSGSLAEITVNEGGLFEQKGNRSAYIAYEKDSQARINVNGGTFTQQGGESFVSVIASHGSADIEVSNGGEFTQKDNGSIAYNSDSSATITVNGGEFTSTGGYLGNSGSVTIDVRGGGTFTLSSGYRYFGLGRVQTVGYIAYGSGSSATITVSDRGTFTQSAGGIAYRQGSSATITVSDGCTFMQSGGCIAGYSGSSATITVNGGEFTSTGGYLGDSGSVTIDVKERGKLSKSGGYIRNGTITVEEYGTFTLSGDATVSSGNTITVNGRFVQEGGTISYTSAEVIVGEGGVYAMSGGTNGAAVTVNRGGSYVLLSDSANVTGEVTLNGGSLNLGGLEEGDATIIFQDGSISNALNYGGTLQVKTDEGTTAGTTLSMSIGINFSKLKGFSVQSNKAGVSLTNFAASSTLTLSGENTMTLGSANAGENGALFQFADGNGTLILDEGATMTLQNIRLLKTENEYWLTNASTVTGWAEALRNDYESYGIEVSLQQDLGKGWKLTATGLDQLWIASVDGTKVVEESRLSDYTNGVIADQGLTLTLTNPGTTQVHNLTDDGTKSSFSVSGSEKVVIELVTSRDTIMGGDITVTGGAELRKTGTGAFIFSGTLSTDGELVIQGGSFNQSGGYIAKDSDSGATITVENDGTFTQSGGYIAYEQGSNATITVNGGGTFTQDASVKTNYIAYDSDSYAEITVNKGGLFEQKSDQGSAYIAHGTGSQARINVDGGTFTQQGGEYLSVIACYGSADIEVSNDGIFTQKAGGKIAYGSGSSATITVNNKGTFTQTGGDIAPSETVKITVNGGGQFIQNGGWVAGGGNATIVVDGSYELQSNSSRIANTNYSHATIEVNNNGKFTSGGIIAYYGSAEITVKGGGTFTQTGGNIAYDNNASVDITVEGGGTFTQSRGYIAQETGYVTITVNNGGTFTQNGGYIAFSLYSRATITVNRGGTFTQRGGSIGHNSLHSTITVNGGGNYNYLAGKAPSIHVMYGGYLNLIEDANYTNPLNMYGLYGSGHITVNDSATYDLGSGTGTLDIIMRGGSLVNAGGCTRNVSIDTGADYSGEVSLGGLNAAQIESVTIAGAATSITDMASGSTLSFHKGDSITVGSGHMSDAKEEARNGYILNFTDDSGTVAFAEDGAVVLNFTSDVLEEALDEGDIRKEIWLTNGTIDGVPTGDLKSWLEEHFVLGAGLEGLSLVYIEGVDGGKLLLYGKSDGIWIASRNGQEVTSVTRLDKFKQVQADEDLTLKPGEAGTMHVRQLQSGGGKGDLIVESVEGLTVQLDNEHTDETGINGNTVFSGNIRVEEGDGATAVLEKTGSASLTVSGNVTTGGAVQVSAGTLKLAGAGNSIGSLAMGGGKLDVAGTLELTGVTTMTGASTGTITGTGDLKMGTGASLTLGGAVSYSVSNTVLEGEAAFTNNSSSAMQGAFRLQDSARLGIGSAGASGSVSLQDKAVLDLGNAGASGLTVTMAGGQLTNGGSFQGHVAVQTGSSYSGEIKLGGVDAACITSINTQGSGTYLTGLKAGSTLTLSGENSMAVSTDNLNYAGSSNTYLIQFEGSGGTIAFAEGKDNNVGFLLNLDAKVIAALRKQEEGVELYFTNGQITGAPGEEDSQKWRDWVKEHIHFTETLESLGYAVVGIEGGKLLISGSTEDVYLVKVEDDRVNSPLRLGRYDAVVVDETLTLDFNVAEDPAENSVIHNLRSGAGDETGDLLVEKSGEKALTLELNNTKESKFLASSSGGGGNLTVTVGPGAGALTLIKTGTEKLTVEGNLTTPGSLEVQKGTLELGGAASSVGSLEVESSAKLVLSDKAKLTMGNHQLTTGRISGPGELDWDGGLSLSGTVELDGVKLDMENGESLKIDGVTVRMGNGQIGGMSAAEVNVTNHGEFELKGGNIDRAGTRVSVDGAGFTQSGGYIGEGAQFELKNGATLTQSGGEIAGGTFSLSGGTTMSQGGDISGGTFTLSGAGTGITQTGGTISGKASFTLNAGTAMTQSGGEIEDGTFRLSGKGASLTQGAGGIISDGEFTLSEGATMSQSGSITGGTYKLSGGTTMSQSGAISGGTFTLSGAGTSITQAGGAISGKTEFTMENGAMWTQSKGSIADGTFTLKTRTTMTQDGGEIRSGSFSLSGASLTQGAGGSIAGGEFTLSGGATMTASGSITGGSMELSGTGTSFTQSAGSIGESVEITLKDGAKISLSGGSMSGSVTLEGTASSYDMGNQEAGGSVLMKGGKLENAGSFTGKLSIETGDTYTEALDLGGVDAARITKVVMGSSQTELQGLKRGSTLTFGDSASKMVVGGEHIAQGDATGTAMVQFEGATGNIAFTNEGKLLLHLESEVLEDIEGQKEIVFTNGSFSGMPEGQEELEAWLAQHFVLESGMEGIKVLLLDDVHGGRLVLTGSTSGIWLTSRNGQSVDVVDRLNHYSAVVVDKDLTLTLPTTAEEHPTIVKQLQNSTGGGDFIVQTEGGAEVNHTVELNNVHTDAETQNGNTDFYGDIRVEGTGLQAATLKKTGDATLTVHGDVTTGGTVQLSEGTLKLAGSGNGIDALDMNGGELDVAGTLRLTGSTAMTETSTGSITGEGTVEMGSGASLTLAGTVSYTVQNTDLTGGAQMKQEEGSSITGGSFQLSGYGTAFEQEGGSISKTNYTLTDGATMEAGGSVTGGSFVLSGKGVKFTQMGGSLSGVEFELSGGATMEASGSITGGGFELTGSGTIFTQSGGSMDEKTTFSLKDGAKLVLNGGSMAGSVTLEGAASSYDMGGQAARGSVLMKGGKLENAGGFDGELSIQTAESYSGEIKLGGVNAACITNIQLGAAGTYLTGLKTGSTLTLRGKNSLVVDSKQFNYTGTSPTYLIRFENESGSVTFAEEDGEGGSVGVLLKLSAKEIATLRQLGGEAEFYFTNGQITGAPDEVDSPEWREWVASHFRFTKTLESLGFAVVNIVGGKLIISGSTEDIYFVSVQDNQVDSPLRLGRYEAVVVDTDLTLDFNVAEEPEENSVIHNLRSGADEETGDLLVKKSGEYELTLELNNTTESALSPYRNIGGNLKVTVEEDAGELSLIKTGEEKLTVGGNLTTPGSLEVQEGTLEVGGADSSVGSLEVEEGAGLVLSGGAKLHMGNHEMATGRISGPGELDWDGDLSLSGTVGLDDVTLDMKDGESLKITGVTVSMGDGQIGGGESPVSIAVEKEGETKGSFTLEGGSLGSGEEGVPATLDVKGSEFVQAGGVIQQGAEVTLSDGATMEQRGGRIKGGTIRLEGDATSLTQGGQGRISAGSFTLSDGASLRNSGKISGGSFSLSGNGTKMEGAGAISNGAFTLSEGATMSQSGSITGGTYGLSGEGTSFTQTDGSISGVEFTVSERATLTQSGGEVAGGTFTLSGAASLRNDGEISGGNFSLSGSGTKMEGEGAISNGAFTLSGGATMSQSGSITGGTYGLSGEGTSFTQTDGSISGVEFTLSEGATLTQNGGEIQSGTFTLSGAASLRNDGEISGGNFSLSGSGTKMEGAGAISNGVFTLSGGAAMSQSGSITGGTYGLSGEGTGFTQTDGSISGVEFTSDEGAVLTQNGGEIQSGTFSLNGAGLTQGTEGSISGGEFTLNNGATMETSGSITGGSMELSGTGTGLTQSAGSIGEGVELLLKDGARIALSGGSMAGSVTLEGTASSYDMGNRAAEGSVLMQGGRLENAGEFRGELSLETAKEYTAALELGGVDAARITKVVTGSSQTELHDLKSGSTLTFRDGESKMVVGAEHVYREGQEASSMVQFREGNGQIAFEGDGALQLHLNLDVLKGIDGNGIEGQVEILFTNGSFSGMPEGQEDLEAWLEERFVLDAGMQGISVLLLDDVHGGRLVLTGSTSGIWITSRNGQSVDVADLLNRYSAVIVDEGLTLTLPTTPEETPTIIHQLQNESDEHGDLLVQTEAGATANHTVQLDNAHTNEHRNNGDTDFYGNISVEGEGLEAATLEKTGDARLTVHGDVTTDGTVRLSEGVLELEGEGNGIGALDMNGGELDVAGKLRLTGTTTMTGTSAGTITGAGSVELGSGASFTLAGAVSYTVQSTELTDGAQMRQEGESSITGESFRLSGEGTAFVQESGSISGVDFSLTEGAAMEAGGSVTGGRFVLRGEGVTFTQTGGSLSGVEFTLSEGATMETSGSITGGSMELSGTGTSLTQSAGSIGEDVQLVLKDGAGLVLSGGSMAGSVTLEGAASSYDMGGQAAGGSVLMKGGRLENAENYAGTLTIETDDAYTGDLELGGVDAALITDVQTKGEVRLTRLKEGSTLTLHGDHSMRVAVNNTNYGEQEAQALIEFNGTGGRVALEDNMTLLLDLNADVLAGLRRQKKFELLFTNGNFVIPGGKDALIWVQEHFTFREVLEKLGFAVESVKGGALIISGSTEDVYIVGEDGSEVDSALQLGRYKGVIVDEDLTLDLDVQENAAENSVLRNVDSLGNQTDLNIEKSGEGSITVELHNDEDTDTELGGDLVVNKDEREGTGSADLLKSGSGKLTVGGKLQTEDNLTVADGTLALEGQGSSVGSLNLGGADEAGNETSGELQVDGTLTLTGDSDMSDDRGSITGGGRLAVDGEVQLGEGVQMDGPALELGSEGSLTASGELRLQGVNGQGSLSGRDVTVQGSGGSFGGTLTGSLTVEGRGAQQTLTGEVQGREADLHVQDGGTLKLLGARTARSGEEPLPSEGTPSYGSVENGQGGTLRIEAASEEANGSGGAGIHVENDIVFRDDSTTELVFNMNSDRLWDEHDATMLETNRTIYIEDNAHFVLESLGEVIPLKLGDLVNVKVMQGSKVVLGDYAADGEGSAAAGEEAGEAELYSEGAPEENGLTGDGEADGEVELAEDASPEISRNLDVVELRGLFHVYFTGAWLGVDESTGTVYLNGKYRTASLFNGVANSRNSHAGANLLWETSQVLNLFADQGILSVMSARVADTLDSDPAESRRIMAAVAGSTVTSLSAAQRDVMRGRMQSVRNHAQAVSAPYESIEQKTRPYRVIPVKGWKDGVREETTLTRRDVRGLHAWMEGVGDFHEQHTRGDESGYRLNAWGGAAGADLRLSEETVVGLSLSALYGDLTANASDTAKGDWDSYTVSLWGRTRDDRWAHTFVVSAGLNDAKLNRTVNYGAGSYTAHGKTDGYSLGALYELSYDVPLNRDSTHVLQPFVTASVMHGVVNGYAESSPDRTGLNVGEQELTLATLALGTRWLMLMNASKTLNRTIRTELRAAVAQDFGERRAEADVALQANPGYATGVYGSRAGSTALQFGGNVLIPVTGSMDMTLDANADLRAHSAGWNASVGVRFGF